MSSIIEEHYRRNYSTLVKRMIYRVGNQSLALAEEVVQEAYCRAIKYFNRFDPKRGEFDQWFSIILNNALQQVRNTERTRGVSYEIDAIEEWHSAHLEIHTSPATLITPEDVSRFKDGLERAINNENIRDQSILTLFFVDGFGSKEIGEWLNMNNGTVRQVINRFRDKIVKEPKGMA